MSAVNLAAETMAETGLDGYTIAALRECGPACWMPVTCTTCGRRKHVLGRSEAMRGEILCDHDCPGYTGRPRAPHLFGPDDETRGYTDLIWLLRQRVTHPSEPAGGSSRDGQPRGTPAGPDR